MKSGDLIQIQHAGVPDYKSVAICLDSEVIVVHSHYGTYKAVRLLNSDGTITAYPIDRWNFEVIQ